MKICKCCDELVDGLFKQLIRDEEPCDVWEQENSGLADIRPTMEKLRSLEEFIPEAGFDKEPVNFRVEGLEEGLSSIIGRTKLEAMFAYPKECNLSSFAAYISYLDFDRSPFKHLIVEHDAFKGPVGIARPVGSCEVLLAPETRSVGKCVRFRIDRGQCVSPYLAAEFRGKLLEVVKCRRSATGRFSRWASRHVLFPVFY
jgi:hypothetical protein